MTTGSVVNRLLRYGRHALLLTLLTAIIGASMFLDGCGGSSKKTTPVDIQLSPAATTIPINSSVDMQASGSSLVKYTTIVWEVQDEDIHCTTSSVPPEPPSPPCLSGWISEEPITVGVLPQTAATYYSPSQPGTYPVVAVAQTLDGSTGQAISTITVTP
ncbi:MAG TPA: hypothetical protein VGG04_10775 [Candidatus Sulfotelmatobacter sp.]